MSFLLAYSVFKGRVEFLLTSSDGDGNADYPPLLLMLLSLLSHLQVCQFVVSVNGINVLHLDYRTVSHLILTGPRMVVMEVMEEQGKRLQVK